jgi:hypothetical protein
VSDEKRPILIDQKIAKRKGICSLSFGPERICQILNYWNQVTNAVQRISAMLELPTLFRRCIREGGSEATKILIAFGQCLPSQICRGTEFIDGKQFIRLGHPPYSQDIAPSDFDLFGMLQEKLKICTPRMFDELKQEAEAILRSIPEAERISVCQAWLTRSQQVIDTGGEYRAAKKPLSSADLSQDWELSIVE